MSGCHLILLGDASSWWRIDGGEIVARGVGVGNVEEGTPSVAVIPARDVALFHADLPQLTEPQALAAVRLLVAERSAVPLDALHVVVGSAAAGRPVVAIARERMMHWLALLEQDGIDPDVVIPAVTLIARPDAGFVTGVIGDEVVVRGADSGFVDDAVMTPILTGGAPVRRLSAVETEQMMIGAVVAPELNLRQGAFAKRRSRGIEWPRVRRIGWLSAGVAAATLVLALIEIVRINGAARRIEAANVVTAQAVLPPGTVVNNPVFQVRDALGALRGPGGGALPLAAGVASAVEAVPGVVLTSMIFDGGGTLRISARAARPADLAAFETKLAAAGLVAAAGPAMVDQGRSLRDYTVSAR